MKKVIRYIISACLLMAFAAPAVKAQSVKMSPIILVGAPNLQYEQAFSRRITANIDAFWLPWLFKKNEEVFRVMELAGEVRYYIKESGRTDMSMPSGLYAGVYAMYGQFNIGMLKNNDLEQSYRDKGWAMSAGVSVGYKVPINARWAIDANLGLGFAHLQWDKYKLGGFYADYPLQTKKTRLWIGPTRFNIAVVYNIPPDMFRWKHK
ncbi:MAG: DUF3575 domain-containing protein [Muribaculaceae bacterium]|nr:DUF3575 domain-containing protein [Muribaculaceae bacterium]MDE5845304.1 DUF3575 domain-containing protein [Muribaculaceae bacterium]MDE5857942.1 DUF3575 domain-containing protein [Muribaculaceae bacterium]MDE7368154.1 DUF3575 domain-containing protein [Muribaculaceae bacterium]